jgi:sugar phosphate isomerase/epimerase
MTLLHTLSFQLYSSRNFPPLSDQLATLQGLGYTNVEPYGALYEDAAGLRALLDQYGLVATSGHMALDMLENDYDTALSIIRTLGLSIVIAPFLPPALRPNDAEGWKAVGVRLGAVAAKLAAEGIAFGWHNHAFEFIALPDGSYPIEHLLQDPAVKLELDVAWVVRAEADPLPWITRYADRLIALHIKDIAPAGENLDEDGWADVGHGKLDWPAYWQAATATGVKVIVAEHDNPSDFVRFATRSAESIKRLAQ